MTNTFISFFYIPKISEKIKLLGERYAVMGEYFFLPALVLVLLS